VIVVRMAVIGWKPPLARAQTSDPSVEQRLNDVQSAREAAEELIVDQECATLNADRAFALSRIGLQTDDGLTCAAKLIDALSIEKIAGHPDLLVAPNALWRLVDRAVVRPERRPAIRALLERIRSQIDHPMRAHAWLGLRMLDREDGTLVLQGSPLPCVAATYGTSRCAPPAHTSDAS
jgi:hypothetical protein